MKTLVCDIHLGGSTVQFLEWNKRNSTKGQFVNSIKKSIQYKAKTIPAKQAKRAAALIGVVYDQLSGDPYLLDVIIQAINELN